MGMHVVHRNLLWGVLRCVTELLTDLTLSFTLGLTHRTQELKPLCQNIGPYSRQYTGTYSGTYSGVNTGPYSRLYTGPYSRLTPDLTLGWTPDLTLGLGLL